ncbi:hypothetical protein OIU91_05875 [Streptomyces sp. NBC_01456]|uniref:hypothetical protein n=1 Tax=unclassified Streptomyces TaxID=2593676 RepID=UPI002E37E059|nr:MULTISPECIES: hypothetical protein [unclassified Streptomyces]
MGRIVPVSASVSPGQFITGALWNAQLKALNDFTTGVPVFAGYQGTVQSVSTGTFTPLTIDTEVIDSDGGHSTTTNTSRYTATVPGTYLVLGTAAWAANATGYRRTSIALNGTRVPGSSVGSDATTSVLAGNSTSTIVVLNGTTDYVEVHASQSTGSALNTSVTDFAPSLRVIWLSR